MQTNQYIQQLFFYLEKQQKEISKLKQSVSILSTELKQLKEKPAMTVEKLEYKFDQLKVETLEGTLNIGINPADLNAIDDIAIPSSPMPQSQNTFVRNTELYENVMGRLNVYIDGELDTLIQVTEKQIGIELEKPYINIIKDDIRRQLPGRTEHYLNFFHKQSTNEVTEEEMYHKVYKTILADINKAVHGFISQMPINQGGVNPNGT